MALELNLPPPALLEIHDQNTTEKWTKFSLTWNSYSLATELNKKLKAVEVATLLAVIGETFDLYSTFMDWAEGDRDNFSSATKVCQYCQCKFIPIELETI